MQSCWAMVCSKLWEHIVDFVSRRLLLIGLKVLLIGLKETAARMAAIAGALGCRPADRVLLLLCVQMGYGAQKTGPIPANSWLEFDVSHILALDPAAAGTAAAFVQPLKMHAGMQTQVLSPCMWFLWHVFAAPV